MALAKEHEYAPVFVAQSQRNKHFSFSTLGGRPVALTFLGSAGHPVGKRVADDLMAAAETLATDEAVLCAVTFDQADREQQRIVERPALIVFHDEDLAVAKLYGIVEKTAQPKTAFGFLPATFLLDERLRIVRVMTIRKPESHVAEVVQALAQMPRPGQQKVRHQAWAPVLVVPRIFEPEFCRALIDYYETQGGRPVRLHARATSGMTVGVLDDSYQAAQRRRSRTRACARRGRARILRRLVPEIKQAFLFEATRIERYIVACYDAADWRLLPARTATTPPGHRAPPLRRHHQPERRGLRRRRPALPGVRQASLPRRRPAARWCSPARCCTRRRR